MKKTITLSFILSCFTLLGQSWGDLGANWKYSYMSGFGTEGYVEISYVGDTLINTQLSQKLSKNLYAYDFVSNQPVNIFLGLECTYENNGVVFVRYNNDWDTLYNFNAIVGESWRMAKQPFTNACDLNSTLTVVAIGTTTINTIALNYKVVEFNYGGSMPTGLTDTIIQKIGFIGSYMFPYDNCDGSLDMNEGGPFRCYTDNLFATYQPHYIGACDYVSIDEILDKIKVEIFPNPSSDLLQLKGDMNLKKAFFEINNLAGQQQLSGIIEDGIDISNLPQGLYIISVFYDKGKSNLRFVKK
jgi:hypothetical protein